MAKYIRALSTVPDWRAVRALHQKKQRQQQRLFLAQGRKVVEELLASGWSVRSIHALAAIADRYPKELVSVHPAHELERMGTLESGNEVIAVAAMPAEAVHAPLPGMGLALALALDGISDPGNLGTLLRIADWFGVAQVLLSVDCVEEFNPKCVQAAMGSLFRVPIRRAILSEELARHRSDGAALYLASMEGASLFDVPLQRPAVLVMGSESHGPSESVRALQALTVAVPRGGQAESLNVAAAASALCMEFMRQARTA